MWTLLQLLSLPTNTHGMRANISEAVKISREREAGGVDCHSGHRSETMCFYSRLYLIFKTFGISLASWKSKNIIRLHFLWVDARQPKEVLGCLPILPYTSPHPAQRKRLAKSFNWKMIFFSVKVNTIPYLREEQRNILKIASSIF